MKVKKLKKKMVNLAIENILIDKERDSGLFLFFPFSFFFLENILKAKTSLGSLNF